jgi:hypothetical protein
MDQIIGDFFFRRPQLTAIIDMESGWMWKTKVD